MGNRLEIAESLEKEWTCPEHGTHYGYDLPQAGRITWECPDCGRESQAALQAWHGLWNRYVYWDKRSNIPFRFRNRTLVNWTRDGANKPIGDALDRFVAAIGSNVDAGAGMTLLGPPGLGKTHILTAIVAATIKAGHTARYAVWPDVVTEVKNSFNLRRDQERPDPLEVLRTVDLLALDELALKASGTDFESGLLFEVLDYRYRERLCTLAASNATKATLGAAVGDRIADRLLECSPDIALLGSSRRAKAEGSTEGPPQFEAPPDQVVTRVHGQGKWRERVKRHEPWEGRL